MIRPVSAGGRVRSIALTFGLAAMSLIVTAPVGAQEPSAVPGSSAVPGQSGVLGSPSASLAPATQALFPEAGFRVALPADWLAIELAPDPDAAQAAFAADHPELADVLATMRLSGPLDTFAVAPPVDGDRFPTTFASFQGMNMGMSADQMQRLGVSGLQQLGVDGEIVAESLEISGTPAYHLGYAWDLPLAGGGTAPVYVDQYALVTPESVLVFSVTDDVAAPDGWRGLAESFALLP